jgi:glutathione S-transferase
MKLFINDSSPYSRVVRVVVLEKGLSESVSVVWSNPWADDKGLLEHNPVGRIPVLLTHDGVAITESLLIAQYLDSLSSLSLLQPAGDLRCVQLVGLGLGLMEAAFTQVVSEKFEGALIRDSFFGRRREQAIARSLVRLNDIMQSRPCEAFTLGEIVIGVALSYLAFRAPLNDWQSRFLSLRDLHERLSVRSSFQQTPFK